MLIQKVLPFLSGEFTTPDLIPFILPSVFIITEQACLLFNIYAFVYSKSSACMKLTTIVKLFHQTNPTFHISLSTVIEHHVKSWMDEIIFQANQKEFTSSILPSLIPVFSLQKPYQVIFVCCYYICCYFSSDYTTFK